MYNENQKLKLKVKELQAYKDDVSKTFKILDNELIMINDHIQRRQQPQQPQQSLAQTLGASLLNQQPSSFIPTNRVSLLTPELLNTVFFDIQPQQRSMPSTAIINTVVENIPVSVPVNNYDASNEVDNNVQEMELESKGDNIVEENKSVDGDNKSLEEKLDERALEEMLKNVEISTMNDVRLRGEENEYNNLLIDLNKFKVNNL
jgi:hypothetical protein